MNSKRMSIHNPLAVLASLMLTMSFATTANAGEIDSFCPAGLYPSREDLSVVCPAAGPFVIVNRLEEGEVDFMYGWRNAKQMDPAPCAYWIGLYDHTDSHYLWNKEVNVSADVPKQLKQRTSEDEDVDRTLVTGHQYSINFYVRKNCAPNENLAELEEWFVAP